MHSHPEIQQPTRFTPGSPIARAAARARGVVLLDDTRSFFRGPLREALGRCAGGHVVYVALDAPLRARIGQEPWFEAEMIVAAPYEEHSIRSVGGRVAHALIEAEDVRTEDLPAWMTRRSGAIDDPQLIARWVRVCATLDADDAMPPLGHSLDTLLFGGPLARRRIDARVARVVQHIIAQPGERHSAEECAQSVGLSVSRFLHLFKQEVGTPFRPFRAWKRARSLLNLVNKAGNLTDMALDSGYTDSSHFSNSVRNTYGVKASEMVATARRLLTFRRGGAAAKAMIMRH